MNWLRNLFAAQRNALAVEEYRHLLEVAVAHCTKEEAVDIDSCDDSQIVAAIDDWLSDQREAAVENAVEDGELRPVERSYYR